MWEPQSEPRSPARSHDNISAHQRLFITIDGYSSTSSSARPTRYKAVTDYFVQGRSFKDECWLVDLAVPPNGIKRATLYVLLTRFKTLDHVRLLRPLYTTPHERKRIIKQFLSATNLEPDLAANLRLLKQAARETEQRYTADFQHARQLEARWTGPTYARSRMDSPDPKRQRLEPTSSYNLRCRTLVTSSSIDPPDAKRQRLDTAASQSSTSTVGPPAVAMDSRSVTFHVTFTAGPTETNEDRLFAGAQSRYGSFIAGVNTAGQGIVIMQIDDVILGRLESSHAFGHRVTFANVDAASLPPFITSRFAGLTVGQFKVSSATRISVEPSSAVPMLYSARLRFPVYDVGSDRARPEDKHASDGSALLLIPHGGMFRGGPFRKFKAWVACGNGDSPDAGRVELAIRESAPDDFVAQLQAAADSSTPLYVRSYPVCTDSIAVMQQLPNYDEFFGSASFADNNDRMAYAAYDSFTVTASLPPFITSRFAGVTVGQFKVSSATRISVEPSSAVPMLYSARLRFPVYDVGSDRARPEDKHASDGSALLLIPHGGMFRGGPFRKFKAWVACGNGDSPDAGRVELAIRESAPDDFVAQLQAAADSSTPLYVYGAKISPSNSKAYMNSVFLSGSLVAAASAPGKRPPKRVHTFQAAVQRTTAATVPADTTDMVLAWEQRSRSALVLPSDGPHASATLSPNPTSVTVVGSLPVLPLVLTIGSRSYPVCTDSIAVMQQLPNYDEFFGSTSFADDNDRMAYAAYDSFTITGTITTKTEGRTTFITALQE
ncbi:hypothetical protein VOLCADRAFT_100523 [Volvox carteri f. nagariensis]|uniref:Uncharacterized protein n=1 Tax=Volvox carteri f. nagariensis TaxID=3068 RepID=D8UKE0_VOLCA|nr:uncharacterized protein VOLCADRAFT_100523 [Volvox carteri f. nagariensis]EFJ39806.1 hypothetical protein VOLCADRAFT_100523 [Volvox carteri f. nagariensis]|eukprot:XP_002959125.1 hypothetical protein VOLCADRAFT_100523 [Volvox carteri f. nagariensis]